MEYRQLGSTGLKVSAFGMGCGNFGGIGSAPEFFGQGESEEEAFVLLDRAVEIGINFFDTADAYGGGRSETTLGRWLATKDTAVRENLLISSKVGNPVGEGPNRYGLSRRHILRQIEVSLGRLGVDHLDMYLVHEVDPTTPLEETVEVLDGLVTAGKVRYIGISNHAAWQVTRALWISERRGLHRFDWVQDSFNLIEQADRAELLAVCRDQGLGFTPFSPLGGGWLTGKYQFEEDYPQGSRMTLRPEPYLKNWNKKTFEAIDRLGAMAADLGVSTAGLALGWLHHHPDITSPIVGPRRVEHFVPIGEAMALDLPATTWRDIADIFTDQEV